jgi:hypothetical protein
VRGDHDAVYGSRYRHQIGIATHAFDLGRVRIDRYHLKAGAAQFPIDGVCHLLGLPGDTCDGEAFSGEKLGDGGRNSRHE